MLCFFSRLDHPITWALKRIIYMFITFTAGYSLACLLAQTLLCHPVSAYWAIPEPNNTSHRSCTSQHIYYPLQGSLSSVSTLYSMAIPVLTLRNLPMSQNQRVGMRMMSVLGLWLVLLSLYINHADLWQCGGNRNHSNNLSHPPSREREWRCHL